MEGWQSKKASAKRVSNKSLCIDRFVPLEIILSSFI